MKAINCPQCGATIENVSERSGIVDCEYCGARIMMDRLPPAPPDTSLNSGFTPDPSFKLSTPPGSQVNFGAIAGVAVAVISIFLIFISFNSKTSKPTPSKIYTAPSSPTIYSTPSSSSVSTEPAKPVPVVNYQPRVLWDGPNDMEYFEDPEVDISSVSDLTSDEVKKTVFKNRVAKLRVIINTDGEIDTVEPISGHPLLVEAATESAKKSIFKQRAKPTTRILTYTFRVLPD